MKKDAIGKTEAKGHGKRRPEKLNVGMLRLLILGWLLPMVLLGAVVFYIVTDRLDQQTKETIEESADTAVDMCAMRLMASVQASRNASYIPDIKDSWKNYQIDHNAQKLYDGVYNFISQNYKYDENFLSTMVYFPELEQVYYIYSSIADADYDSVRFFREHAREAAAELSERIDTKIGFLCVEDHLYMVRNIVDKNFQTFATIVMELDKKVIFQSMKGIGWYEDSCVFMDGECVDRGSGKALLAIDKTDLSKSAGSLYCEQDGYAFVCSQSRLEGHELQYVVLLDYEAIHYERTSMLFMIVLALLFTIPLALMIFAFLYRNVNAPVRRLIDSAHEIEEGNFGYQIESRENSEEFEYLTRAFNSMSDRLKNQFEQIYLEELALKDADIKALQSQINPHFLNNTLEIINWEARMGGNSKVSSMIEALSTMLEATLNRKRQPMITLAEELEYVDAYCHIIKQRFEEKLQFEKQVEERLLDVEVPRPIIQPIIENAVEHGLGGKQGKIGIRIFLNGEDMNIEVINDGVLTEKDRKRIDMLLDGTQEPERSVSLGICNVNKRLKIIYGSESGLTIDCDSEGRTVSRLVFKLDKTGEQ